MSAWREETSGSVVGIITIAALSHLNWNCCIDAITTPFFCNDICLLLFEIKINVRFKPTIWAKNASPFSLIEKFWKKNTFWNYIYIYILKYNIYIIIYILKYSEKITMTNQSDKNFGTPPGRPPPTPSNAFPSFKNPGWPNRARSDVNVVPVGGSPLGERVVVEIPRALATGLKNGIHRKSLLCMLTVSKKKLFFCGIVFPTRKNPFL